MNRKQAILWTVLLANVLVPARAQVVELDPPSFEWAMPISVSEPPNVFRVSDTLYRGGKVSKSGAAQLRCLGINTAVSLRLVGGEAQYVTREGINYVHIPMKAWRPNEDEVVQFLRIAVDPNCQPVYIYCKFGADRTGMMCAVYRVVVQGWSKEDAISEMTQGPFGYHPVWKDVVQFVRDMDVERIRCRVGL